MTEIERPTPPKKVAQNLMTFVGVMCLAGATIGLMGTQPLQTISFAVVGLCWIIASRVATAG